jgi:predicted RNA-binding Zn ribbon-like protein
VSERRPEPGNREPAPDHRIRAVQDFLNTADLEAGVDDLDSIKHARTWLARQGFAPRRITAPDHRRLLEFREALRALVAANNAVPLARRDVERLNRSFSAVALRPLVDADGDIRLSGGQGLDAFQVELLENVIRARANRTWSRLKACRRAACRWAFWDASRSQSGTWCTMALCGSREKMRAYRIRQRKR